MTLRSKRHGGKVFRRNRSGHTLIESMMAAFLALICALIFSATMPVANLTRGKADHLNTATSLSQKVLESVRGQGYPNSTPQRLFDRGLIESLTSVSLQPRGLGTAGESGFPFTNVDTGILDSPATVLPNGEGFLMTEMVGQDLRRVTVVVAWRERGTQRSLRVSTLVANL